MMLSKFNDNWMKDGEEIVKKPILPDFGQILSENFVPYLREHVQM